MNDARKTIGRPSKYPKLVNGLRRYLADARADPSLPLTKSAISMAIDVKKSTIYLHQHDPEVSELLASIRVLAQARKLALGYADELNGTVDDRTNPSDTAEISAVGGNTIEPVDLDVLVIRSSSAVQRAVWCMGRFMGRHRKHRYVSDLPRIVFDLDSTLAQLRRIREELGGLSEEWIQIPRKDNELGKVENQLILSLSDEQE